MNGSCKLCGQISLLKESHIIPDFYIRGLEHKLATGSQGIAQPFSILLSANPDAEGGAKQRGQWEKILGIKEYLLCGQCEQRFSRYEAYARNLFYGNSSPLKKIPIGNLIRLEHAGETIEIRRISADYQQLKCSVENIFVQSGSPNGGGCKPTL
jgi:hypothetical protein